MTAINLPGQHELPIVVDHKRADAMRRCNVRVSELIDPRGVEIAKLLQSYEERPTSETWSRIQALAAEILK